MPPPPRLSSNAGPTIGLGFAVIALLLGGLATWGALAPLASAVIAPGTVIVDGHRKQVQHLDGGIVSELLVREGDRVEAGQVLIRLDETRARGSSALLQTAHDAARALEARLLAEASGATELRFSESLSRREHQGNVAELLQAQRRLFAARRTALDGQTTILQQRASQLQEEINGIEAQRRAKERQSALIAEELSAQRTLLAKGLTEKTWVLALEREAARLDGERGELMAAAARCSVAIGETRLQVLQAHKAMQQEVADGIRAAQAQIFDLEERLLAARHALGQLQILAPAAGTVVGLGVFTIGGVIRAGETLLEIVPRDDRLLIEAQAQLQDIDNVAVGLPAQVRFPAFKQRTTPSIDGIVTQLSADRLQDKRTGQPFYQLRIAVPESEAARLLPHTLMPGLSAEVMIHTGERTALTYLLQPVLDSMARSWREE